ncbi:hypothetical protein MalM25_33680 [Planctomycetes bacterium MalM25]|nr:hypothetical protein MalM25_33680 [Planctomycetes bacterium MalM25]
MRALTLLLIAAAPLAARAQAPAAIDFWVGEGAQSATLTIDWDEAVDAGPALAWGYRWDGQATAEQMLRDVLANDLRLFAKLSTIGPTGVAVYGFGYDRNGDAAFALDDATSFDASGVALSGPADGASAIDPEDTYAEGWAFDGFWHNTIFGAGDGWVSAPTGIADRVLADGDHEGWVYAPYRTPDGSPRTLEELLLTEPEEPISAPAPHLPGDHNGDGRIDAADYTLWRDTHAQTVDVAGAGADADLSFVIDAADNTLWRNAYGQTTAPSLGIPEPASIHSLIAITFLWIFGFTTRRAS